VHGLVSTGDTFEQVHLFASFPFTVATAGEDNEVEDVATEAKDRGNQHDFTVDIARVHQPFHCFGEKPNEKAPDYQNTAEGTNDIGAMVPVRVLKS